MNNESFPQSKPNTLPETEQSVEFEITPDNKEAEIQEALQYVEEVGPTWTLEPTEVAVEQPANQQELIGNLSGMLAAGPEGEQMQRQLQGNLAFIKRMQDQSQHYGFGKLDIKPGYNLNDVIKPEDKISRDEYNTLRDNSWADSEIVDDPDQPNVMMTGLLVATGAEVLRDEIGEDGGITKIYKGMMDGKPVYFKEMVLPRIRQSAETKETTTYLERSFSAVSEHAARHSLNALSKKDAEVLESIGVETPELDSPEYNPATYPNRSRMIETLQLYDMMSRESADEPTAEAVQETQSVTNETLPPQYAEHIESLKKQQAVRDEREKIFIANARARGASEEGIARHLQDVEAMKNAELRRGRLFPHPVGFRNFQELSKPEWGLDMGIDSGFEQGDGLLLKRTSGAVEGGWTFLGVDKKTKLAQLATFDRQTGDKLYKSVSLEELHALNPRHKK